MNSDALISVIIPVYNVENYLDKCVDSVCNQSYKNLEIILIDDGSTDGSGKLCDNWKEKDDRIVVIHKQNGGISNARNAGMKRARGDYFAFVDSDDYIAPDMYGKMLERINADNTDLVICAYKDVDEDGGFCKQIHEDIPDAIVTIEDLIGKMNQDGRRHCTSVVVWNKLYRKETIADMFFREGVRHEDEFYLNMIMLRVKNISLMNNSLYYYTQRQASFMHEKFDERRLAYFDAMNERMEIIEKNGFPVICRQNVARECINSGIRLWRHASINNVLDKKENKFFYDKVLAAKRKYSFYGTMKDKVLWQVFDYCPRMLIKVYKICDAVKHGGKTG